MTQEKTLEEQRAEAEAALVAVKQAQKDKRVADKADWRKRREQDLAQEEAYKRGAVNALLDAQEAEKNALADVKKYEKAVNALKRQLGIRIRPSKPEAPPATEKPARAKRGAKGEVPGEEAAETAAGAIDEE